MKVKVRDLSQATIDFQYKIKIKTDGILQSYSQ